MVLANEQTWNLWGKIQRSVRALGEVNMLCRYSNFLPHLFIFFVKKYQSVLAQIIKDKIKSIPCAADIKLIQDLNVKHHIFK